MIKIVSLCLLVFVSSCFSVSASSLDEWAWGGGEPNLSAKRNYSEVSPSPNVSEPPQKKVCYDGEEERTDSDGLALYRETLNAVLGNTSEKTKQDPSRNPLYVDPKKEDITNLLCTDEVLKDDGANSLHTDENLDDCFFEDPDHSALYKHPNYLRIDSIDDVYKHALLLSEELGIPPSEFLVCFDIDQFSTGGTRDENRNVALEGEVTKKTYQDLMEAGFPTLRVTARGHGKPMGIFKPSFVCDSEELKGALADVLPSLPEQLREKLSISIEDEKWLFCVLCC